ncbi:MAG: regulatory protein RecX, partial [Oscillospiraceae bacterium]|nr:regulatory protein RecX [Oscillospiraceae bacterium]
MEMTVSSIEPYGKGRSAVYLNDSFAFVLYKGELSQYGLEPGVTVDDGLYDRILTQTLFPRARERGMNL